MKKFILLFVNFCFIMNINAATSYNFTYDTAIDKAQGYCNSSEYLITNYQYQSDTKTTNLIPFVYSNGVYGSDPERKFKNSGFLNTNEFNLVKSYLSEDNFWLTKSSGKYYYTSTSHGFSYVEAKNIVSDKKNIRITKYIKNGAKVNGSGTKINPWKFINANVVPECSVGNYFNGSSCTSCPSGYTSNAGATSQKQCYIIVDEGYYIKKAKDSTATKCSDGKNKSRHVVYYGKTSACSSCLAGTYADGTACKNCPSGYTSNDGAASESECYIDVPSGKYIKTAKDSTPTTCASGSYKAAHKVNYGSTSECASCAAGTYLAAGGSTCTACPSGYTSNPGAMSQTDCYINVDAGKYIKTAGTSTPTTCDAGTYKAAHKVNYGSTSSCNGCPSGYTSAAGSIEQSKCYISVQAGKYIATAGSSTPKTCAAGTYKIAHTVNYGSTSSCSGCPSGYTSAEGAISQDKCYINVTAGKYIKTAGNSTAESCAVGTYKIAHTVNYGSTSSCDSCPTGYTSNAGASAQNSCYINVDAGKYIKTAGSSTQTSCDAGTYKIAHTVNYGSTSTCSTCPSGYTSDVGTTAQSSCYVSVSGGKYIKTAGSSTQTSCAAGTFKEAHKVNYGNTSSCSNCSAGKYSTEGATSCTSCPSGYTSDAGATAQSSCYVSVSGGKYIKTVGSSTQTSCAAGTFKEAHKVNYGSTSSCSNCSAGKYSTGGASSCTSCPSGYTSSSGATAQSSCYVSVSGGKYIKTAKDSTPTSCAAGTYKAAHKVNYGSTSSCTPCSSGYTSSTGASSCTACSKGPDITVTKSAHASQFTVDCDNCPACKTGKIVNQEYRFTISISYNCGGISSGYMCYSPDGKTCFGSRVNYATNSIFYNTVRGSGAADNTTSYGAACFKSANRWYWYRSSDHVYASVTDVSGRSASDSDL